MKRLVIRVLSATHFLNIFSRGLTFTAILLLLSLYVVPAGAEQAANSLLNNLRTSTKLNAPDDILADFVSGKSETSIIVILHPTSAANSLAAQSKISAQVPNEFKVAGAPTFYNLQDDSIKTQLRATVTEAVNSVIAKLGATGITVTQKFSYQFGFAARVTPEALNLIVNSPDVLSVEKDRILEPHLAQGIPLMNATTVRNTYTGAGMSIAICDTGIDTSHPSLGGGSFPNAKVIGGYDTGDSDADPRPDSATGSTHGTNCAGIAAGSTGTFGDYIGGVASDAKLYAIKISTGTTGSATTAAMVAGWEWALTHKNDDPNNPIMVISTSFGGGAYPSTCDSASTAMTTAAANAVATGITIFASSGNDGYCDSIGWPACISYVVSVGAVYDANFGTYLPCLNSLSCATKTATTGCATGWYATDSTSPDKVTSYSNSASFLTLFAPANKAYTTTVVGRGDAGAALSYTTSFGGTSAACPYAAGSAAVLQQAAKVKTGTFLTPAEVKNYLVNNGNNVTDSKVAITKPRINLGNSVNALPSGTFGNKTLYLWVKDAAGNISARSSASVNFTVPLLKFSFTGDGYGSVNSNPAGINCTGTAGSACPTAVFSNGQSVTLTAASNSSSSNFSNFSGWNPACNGAGSCNLTMSSSQNVSGNFNRDKLVKFSTQSVGTFATILEALSAATNGQTIHVRDNSGLTPFADALNINKTVTLKGGFAAGFGTNTGYTTTSGKLTVGSGGSLIAERVVIK